MTPKVAVVIPARFKSSRLPGKPLIKLKGKEMIVRVAEIAQGAVGRKTYMLLLILMILQVWLKDMGSM